MAFLSAAAAKESRCRAQTAWFSRRLRFSSAGTGRRASRASLGHAVDVVLGSQEGLGGFLVVDRDTDAVGEVFDDRKVVAVDLERSDRLAVCAFGEWFGPDAIK